MSALYKLIEERLLLDEQLEPAVVNLVDAACSGAAELAAAIAGIGASQPSDRGERRVTKTRPPSVFLSQVEVSGFRGVGAAQKLTVTPGPGLTLVVGRNGSGKSSFADALETVMTGASQRWLNRAKEWRDGWKNLHTDDAFIEAKFAVAEGSPVTLRRIWKSGVDLDHSELRVRRGGDSLTDLGALGWAEPLRSFRPFLSYAELGALLNKPSELYDSLKGILGLEDLVVATKRVTDERKAREERSKRAKDECKRLLSVLSDPPGEPRAERCRDAMKGRVWNLDEVQAVVLGGEDAVDHGLLTRLRALAQLSAPSIDAVQNAAHDLRDAVETLAKLAGTSAEQSARLAETLEKAIHYCGDLARECPVCGGVLGPDWSRTARARLAETRELTEKVRSATRLREMNAAKLRGMIQAPTPALERVAEAGLPSDALATWRAWATAPSDALELCAHAENKIVDLQATLESLRVQARERLQAMESSWRPIALELARWLHAARTVQQESPTLKALSSAEDWLKTADAELRDQRFAPIAAQSQEIWSDLRQQSNVDLAKIKLEGKGTKRHVDLDVSVDGRDGVALGVMSQGELNALALSLFLPRMTLPESPFRFLIIDDPVQAMDPHKVDGLAHVLQRVAKTQQVIVFTHDARLHEAIRRLQIDATVLEVQRRSKSVVEIVRVLDPVERHLKDALSLVNSEEQLGRKTASRAVPGFCRLAIEAACVEAIRRRRLARGEAHAAVEHVIEEAHDVHRLVALAVYDDTERSGDVFSWLKNKLGNWGADTFSDVKEGAHHGFSGSLKDLVDNSRKIANAVRSTS